MWPDRVSNPGPLTHSQVPYRLRYAARREWVYFQGKQLFSFLPPTSLGQRKEFAYLGANSFLPEKTPLEVLHLPEKCFIFESCTPLHKLAEKNIQVRDRAWFVRLYGEIIPEL